MKILLLEDLDTYADVIIEALRKSKLRQVQVIRVATESEFRCRISELIESNFDIAIFDVMVCWCKIDAKGQPEDNSPPPEVLAEIMQKTKWRSGLRCRRMFSEALRSAGKPLVPCIYYTILDREDLQDSMGQDHTVVVAKQGDIQPLVDAILKLAPSTR
jgi:hypothetical protein